jgi:hypothetical protein
VLPIGYSFNLDGSMMYCTFATVFIAQAYGIEMSLGQQMTMMAVLMLTSKGMAGVPRASLVVIAATLGQFNIPEAGMLLLLGIDHFLDMARSRPTSSATASPPRRRQWEGEMDPPKPLKRRKPQPKRHLHGGVFFVTTKSASFRLGAHLPQPAPQDALSMSAQTIVISMILSASTKEPEETLRRRTINQ